MNREAGCIILTYHSISEGRSPIKISPALFESQISWLGSNAQVVPLQDVVDALAHGTPIPARTVVLTFDDGFLDFYSSAAPLLRRAGLPATVFLPTGFCGRSNRWPGQPGWVEEQPLMGWQHITELAEQGFAFGAHSVSHPMLTSLPDEAAVHEIVASKQEIERHLGKPVHSFCYPYGDWNSRVRSVVRAHYRAACSTRTATLNSAADLFSLPRVDAHLVRHPMIFRRLFAPVFPAYLQARRGLRRLRGQPESAYR
jgi:peptidoglycan/xylan/chitin deacetylase (PgdA/CDA1 family)